jgi:hypothetical protein
VLNHFSDATDWSATLLSDGTQPVVKAALVQRYEDAGFSLTSGGLPVILTRDTYVLRLQVATRDHGGDQSYVTVQLSRSTI